MNDSTLAVWETSSGLNMGFRRAGLAGFGGDDFKAFHAPRAQKQAAALGAKTAGRRRAESAGSAGDQNPFARKCGCHAGWI